MHYLWPVVALVLFAGAVVAPAAVALGLRRHAGPLVVLAGIANTILAASMVSEADWDDKPGFTVFVLALVAAELALVALAAIAVVRRRPRWTYGIAVVLAATCLPVLYLALISGAD
jgi:hypothetical protein